MNLILVGATEFSWLEQGKRPFYSWLEHGLKIANLELSYISKMPDFSIKPVCVALLGGFIDLLIVNMKHFQS